MKQGVKGDSEIKSCLGVPWWPRVKDPAVVQVTAVASVQSLAQELPHVICKIKKKKKKKAVWVTSCPDLPMTEVSSGCGTFIFKLG